MKKKIKGKKYSNGLCSLASFLPLTTEVSVQHLTFPAPPQKVELEHRKPEYVLLLHASHIHITVIQTNASDSQQSSYQ